MKNKKNNDSIKDNKSWPVNRVYDCKECNGQFAFIQEANEDFIRNCPHCNSDRFFLTSADCGISTFIDTLKPSSLGMIGTKNFQKAERDGTLPKEVQSKKRPFWRKTKTPNFNVLKNPNKYVQTGEI